MRLLGDSEIESIKNALQDVTDTFFVTPVVYKLAKPSLDRFQEDNDKATFVDYPLNALVEYPSMEKDLYKETEQGGKNYQQVKCSFNYRDIIAAGLSNDHNFVIMDAVKDYIVVNGFMWKVRYVGLDGPIEAENVLLIVRADLEEKKTV